MLVKKNKQFYDVERMKYEDFIKVFPESNLQEFIKLGGKIEKQVITEINDYTVELGKDHDTIISEIKERKGKKKSKE